MIDYILSLQEHVLVIQGIRANESKARSLMSNECRFFKYYFEPYNVEADGSLKINKKTGKPEKPKYHTYRKKEVFEWVKKYDDSILRPVFNWTGQQVIDYIQENGHEPNPLYKQGFSRVGCFPCIQCNHHELLQIATRYPERIEQIRKLEEEVGSTFFPPNYIPERFCPVRVKNKDGELRPIVRIQDAVDYIEKKNATANIFDEPRSCMSFYHLCE